MRTKTFIKFANINET